VHLLGVQDLNHLLTLGGKSPYGYPYRAIGALRS
jgi:hypothetical protein